MEILGGGGFLTYYDNKNKEITTINFRIAAPLSSTKDMFLKDDKKPDYSQTIKAAGVPGTAYGMWMAHEKYGKLDWGKLITPSIKLARDGFPMYQKLYNEIKSEKKYLLQYPSSVRVYIKPDSSFYEMGIFSGKHET